MIFENLLNTKIVEDAVINVCSYIENKKKEKTDWHNFSEEQLWYELVSCILGSRVKFEVATTYSTHLQRLDIVNPWRIIVDPVEHEKNLRSELCKSIVGRRENNILRYPYPNSKANYIIRTAVEIYKNNNTTLRNILGNCNNEYEARELLVKNSVGIGYKQASLFLRNISYSNNLAILDSHVIRFMGMIRIIDNGRVVNISNKKIYTKLENTLLEYAQSKSKPLPILDFAIWIVMRTIQKERLVVWI